MANWTCVTTGYPEVPPSSEQPWVWVDARSGEVLKQTCVHQLYGKLCDFIPLAGIPHTDPPAGEVRLFEPIESLVSDHPDYATWIPKELERRRAALQFALETGDWLVLEYQVIKFAIYTRRLLWQRFRFGFSFSPPADLTFLAKVRALHDQCGDVIFEVATEDSYRVCGPRRFARNSNNAVRVSLEPVFDALTTEGLWVATDNDLERLARVLIGMARRQRAGDPQVRQ